MTKVLEFIYDDGHGFYALDLPRYLDEWTSKAAFFAVCSSGLGFPVLLLVESMSQHQIGLHG